MTLVVSSGVQISSPASAPTTVLGSSSGSLSEGDYQYKVTYVTAFGETLAGAASDALAVGASGSVSVSEIPVSSDGNVTSRKLYRTAADGATYYFLATLADNSTTTYTDIIADATITAGDEEPAASTADSVQQIKGYIRTNRPLISTYAAITAGTTQTQAGATLLTAHYNNVTVGNADDGALLPLLNANLVGLTVIVKNNDAANAAKIYPSTGQTVNGGAANAAAAHAAATTLTYVASSATAWVSF